MSTFKLGIHSWHSKLALYLQCRQKQTTLAWTAEAMSGTIETNIREMVDINDGIRQLVQRVSKESIATASNNGNGSGRVDHEFAGAVEEEI